MNTDTVAQAPAVAVAGICVTELRGISVASCRRLIVLFKKIFAVEEGVAELIHCVRKGCFTDKSVGALEFSIGNEEGAVVVLGKISSAGIYPGDLVLRSAVSHRGRERNVFKGSDICGYLGRLSCDEHSELVLCFYLRLGIELEIFGESLGEVVERHLRLVVGGYDLKIPGFSIPRAFGNSATVVGEDTHHKHGGYVASSCRAENMRSCGGIFGLHSDTLGYRSACPEECLVDSAFSGFFVIRYRHRAVLLNSRASLVALRQSHIESCRKLNVSVVKVYFCSAEGINSRGGIGRSANSKIVALTQHITRARRLEISTVKEPFKRFDRFGIGFLKSAKT